MSSSSLDETSTHTGDTSSTMDCGSLDTILRQLEQERLRMERQRNRLTGLCGGRQYPPLAEPEQFPDDTSILLEENISTRTTSSVECVSSDEDVFLCSSNDSIDSMQHFKLELFNDANGNGTTKTQNSFCRKYKELEEVDESSDDDDVDEYDDNLSELAERYYNIHTSHSSTYSNALTSIVRRRSLSVSTTRTYIRSRSIPSFRHTSVALFSSVCVCARMCKCAIFVHSCSSNKCRFGD